MLQTLHLQNFRGFREHTVEFSKFSVIAGRNNAGKSTLIEAIRIIAEILPRFLQGSFGKAKSWVGTDSPGVHLKLESLGLRAATLFHRYHTPPAILESAFEGGSRLRIILGADKEVWVEGVSTKGADVDSRANARNAGYPKIAVLPQISPLSEDETVLKAAYVQACLETHRASRQFRNQIRYNSKFFDTFKDLFHRTWENVRISSLECFGADYQEPLSLLLSEDGFVAEASDFGHGLQMWLQIVWFLSRTPEDSIVVLDEPDVYVHPEQQSRMLPILRERFRQCLISTHSPAILGNSSIQETLRIHRSTASSRPGLSEQQHEELVKQTLASARQTELLQKTNSSLTSVNDCEDDTDDAEDLDDADTDIGTVEISVTVYEDARFILRDSSGHTLIDLAANGRERGRKITETLDAEQVTIEAIDPINIVVFVNKQRLPPNAISDESSPVVRVDLGNFAND
ncbi:MAG: AAA family ATPase [Planctomycetaceae bacterium]